MVVVVVVLVEEIGKMSLKNPMRPMTKPMNDVTMAASLKSWTRKRLLEILPMFLGNVYS